MNADAEEANSMVGRARSERASLPKLVMRFVLLEVMSKNTWPAYRKAHIAHERVNA